MRADMHKVIIDRPRRLTAAAKSPKLTRLPHPDAKHIGVAHHVTLTSRNTKEAGDRMAPLIRFLRKRKGKLWNNVFKEICANIDTGSVIKMHIREHLKGLVLTNISIGRHGEWIGDGKVIGHDYYGSGYSWTPHHPFFVDPRSGILKEASALKSCLPRANQTKKV